MTRKNGDSNQSVGRGEFIDHDGKHLKRMSAKEIQEYYDRVEPISDDEVKEVYDRIMPKIAYQIASEDQQEKSRGSGRRTKKIVLVVACIALMFTVVAQAWDFTILDNVVVFRTENIQYNLSSDMRRGKPKERELSPEETAAWGEELRDAFLEFGYAPYLPTMIPEGFELVDPFYSINGEICFLDFQYIDQEDRYLSLQVYMDLEENTSVNMSVEYEMDKVEQVKVDGVTYYLGPNINNHLVSWYDDMGVYTLSSTLELDLLEEMIRTIDR